MSMLAFDQLDDCAARRAEGFVINDRRVDIAKRLTHRSSLLLVVIQRCLFHAAPKNARLGIGIDLHVCKGRNRHRWEQ